MAVYTDVSAEDLGSFLAGYDLGELLSYKGIAEGVENSNFLVHTGTGHYILTLYEKRVAAGDVPFFLALMEHLAARGITCPQPVKERNGKRSARCAAGPPPSSPSSTACGCGGRTPATAPRSARRWRACTWPGADFRRHAAQRALGRGLAAAVRTGRGARRRRAARHARDHRDGAGPARKERGRATCRRA